MSEKYPEVIQQLPEADIPFHGVRGRLLQAPSHQVVFFEIEPVGAVAPHSHGAQFGFVFEGEMQLTIDRVTKTYKQGDSYFIPAGVVHQATFKTFTRVMDLFAEPARYQLKK
jgi:quercetin dioxygenase-like cupin family protein